MDKSELNTLFRYKDGELYWKIKERGLNHKRAVGTLNKGYKVCKSKRFPQQMFVHRMIWVMHNGSIPSGMVIDHIDINPTNNSINNLRCVTRSENSINTLGHTYKKSGLPKNVFRCASKDKYRYQHVRNGVVTYYTNLTLEAALSIKEEE